MTDARDLAAAVRRLAAGTPYVVQETADGFDVRVDVADARWSGLFHGQGLRKVSVHHVRVDAAARELRLRWRRDPVSTVGLVFGAVAAAGAAVTAGVLLTTALLGRF